MSVLDRLDTRFGLEGYRRFHFDGHCPKCEHRIVVDIYWQADRPDPDVLIHHVPGDPPTHRPEIVQEAPRRDRRRARVS